MKTEVLYIACAVYDTVPHRTIERRAMRGMNDLKRRWVHPYYVIRAFTSTIPVLGYLLTMRTDLNGEAIAIAIPFSLMPFLVLSRMMTVKRKVGVKDLCEGG